MTYALFDALPALAARVPRFPLGDWPTPVERLDIEGHRGPPLLVKREDLSAERYGGNKIRPIEIMLGLALERGAHRIWSTGSLGSNHAVATALHAPRAGLESGAILFPQPSSETARANLRALYTTRCALRLLPTIALFPLSLARAKLTPGDFVQEPGAATPMGALGHLSAGLELAHQLRESGLPTPAHIVLPVGSTCTTAGLLVATALAGHLGLAWTERRPRIHAVRVTPWPVTATWRIAHLAARTARLLEALGGPTLPRSSTLDFHRALTVTGRHLGRGYGHPTRGGWEAIRRFERDDGPVLDTTYSAKAAAYLLSRRLDGPALFWATKSSAPLPEPTPRELARAPRRIRAWLAL